MSRIRLSLTRAVRLHLRPLNYFSPSYSQSATLRIICPNDVPLRYETRNISFFSKKKFKEEAEEVLKERAEVEDSLTLFEEEEALEKSLTDEQIDKIRDKSRLRPHHYRKLHGEVPHPVPTFWTHHTVAYKRRMYGIYGEKSGINPGLLWPTKEELSDRLEYERIAFPYTIQEMRDVIQQRRQLEREELETIAKNVEAKMELVEAIKAKILVKQQAKAMELSASQERKEKLMEEVRRHFGYTVDPKDERFQEMLQKKEKEQRKAVKEARKLAKQTKQLEKLQQEAQSAKRKSEEGKKVVTEEEED